MCTLPHSQNNRWFQCHYNINFNTLILPSPNEDETFVLTLRTITPSMDSSPCLKDILFHHQFSTSLLHMLLQWDQSCVHSDGVQILPVLPFREYYITWKQKPWLEPRYFTRAALYSNVKSKTKAIAQSWQYIQIPKLKHWMNNEKNMYLKINWFSNLPQFVKLTLNTWKWDK